MSVCNQLCVAGDLDCVRGSRLGPNCCQEYRLHSLFDTILSSEPVFWLPRNGKKLPPHYFCLHDLHLQFNLRRLHALYLAAADRQYEEGFTADNLRIRSGA